jgi:hypothetical protein
MIEINNPPPQSIIYGPAVEVSRYKRLFNSRGNLTKMQGNTRNLRFGIWKHALRKNVNFLHRGVLN